MAKLEGIRACVFDAYGTLFDVHAPVAKLAAEIGPKADELSRLWRQKQLEYSWLRSLMGVHADFWHVTGDALDYALAFHGIDDPGLKDELMVLYLKLDAYPDARAALAGAQVAQHAHRHPLQWQPVDARRAVRSAGLDKLLDQVLSVEDVGIYKPSRRVYRLAMQKLQFTTRLRSASSRPIHGTRKPRRSSASRSCGSTATAPNDRIPGKPWQ